MYVFVCSCARLLFRSLLCDVCLCACVFVSSLAPLLVSSFACLLACLLACCLPTCVCVCVCLCVCVSHCVPVWLVGAILFATNGPH